MNNEESCGNEDIMFAYMVMEAQKPCCRVAFCIRLLSAMPAQMRDIGQFKKHTGFHEGRNDTETAINFLKAVETLRINNQPKSEFQA